VIAGTLVLLHSPLTGPEAWGRLPEVLATRSHSVVAPQVDGDETAPYAARYVAHAAQQVGAAGPREPVVLIGHSGAGPLLGQVGAAQRAARRRIGGYVYLDAGLPGRMGMSRLDLMRGEHSAFAEDLHVRLHEGGRFPTWDEADLADEVPDPVLRRALVGTLRPRGHDFFTEPLPVPADWPDAPCGYLRTSPAYDVPARLAAGRGWPVVRRDLGHFAALRDPDTVADALTELFDAM
jgi:hypothetical protein